MWEPIEDVPALHPSSLVGLLSMVGQGNGWRTKAGIVGHIGADPGGRWCETGLVAGLLGISPARCRVYLLELERERVLWRDGGGGGRLFWVEVNPNWRQWRAVPWRIGGDEESARAAIALRWPHLERPVDPMEYLAAAGRLIARPRGARSAFASARLMGARSALVGARDQHPGSRANGARDALWGSILDRAPTRAMPNPVSRAPGARDTARTDFSLGVCTPDGSTSTTSGGEEQRARGDVPRAVRAVLDRANVVTPERHDIRGRPRALLVGLVDEHGLGPVLEAAALFPAELGPPLAVEWIATFLSGGHAGDGEGLAEELEDLELTNAETELRRARRQLATYEAAGLDDDDLIAYREGVAAWENRVSELSRAGEPS